jgi:hypothetical protein
LKNPYNIENGRAGILTGSALLTPIMLDRAYPARLIRSAMFMVRLASSTDTEQILALGPSAQIDESRQVLVSTSVDRGECFVAEENGVLLGYGIMNYGFFDRGFVPLIYIHIAHRRGHIGLASSMNLRTGAERPESLHQQTCPICRCRHSWCAEDTS